MTGVDTADTGSVTEPLTVEIWSNGMLGRIAAGEGVVAGLLFEVVKVRGVGLEADTFPAGWLLEVLDGKVDCEKVFLQSCVVLAWKSW